MLILIVYVLFILLELVVAIGLCLFSLSMLWSSLKGAPYVPTKKKELINFLREAGIKKGQVFLELGCGDGRVVRTAAKEYGAKGIGIDINPLLIYWARFLAKLQKIQNIELKVENVFKTYMKSADIVYLFLMPEMLIKLRAKFEKESKKGAVFISHGFKIEGWEKYCFKTIPNSPFPTYYYKIKR